MGEIILQPGDVFGTKNPMALGRAIRAIQIFWSKDSEAEFSHSGIILDTKGTTFECLWTVRSQNLFDAYKGEKVIIARYTGIQAVSIQKALDHLQEVHSGQIYPFWRLILHLLPPLAKINATGRPVCSEMDAKFLWLIGARHGQWAGTNPDTLADEWRKWRDFEVIFDGELKNIHADG